MKSYEVDFVSAPKVGTKVRFDGVPFELMRVEAHTRKDGAQTSLLVWAATCVHCGDRFEAATGLRSKTITKRCERHRARGVPATKAAAKRRSLWARMRQKGLTDAQR